jgi:hypothetical protein
LSVFGLSATSNDVRCFVLLLRDDRTFGVEPEQRGLHRLLSNIVGSCIEAFDEEPLPVEVADRAHRRLLALLASPDVQASSDRGLADINRAASFDLLH